MLAQLIVKIIKAKQVFTLASPKAAIKPQWADRGVLGKQFINSVFHPKSLNNKYIQQKRTISTFFLASFFFIHSKSELLVILHCKVE